MMNRIANQITMIENTLKNDADVLSPERIASLKKTLAELVERNAADTLHRLPVPANVEVGVDEVEAVPSTVETPEETAHYAAQTGFQDLRIARLSKTVVAPVVESDKVKAENAKRVAEGRRKMTPEEARRFEMFSEKNAAIVEEAAADRGCDCEAYVSIFTFNRWIAQGRVVKKGEKATFVQVPNFREVVDEKTGEKKKIKIGERRVAVFCKCQTKKLEPKAA